MAARISDDRDRDRGCIVLSTIARAEPDQPTGGVEQDGACGRRQEKVRGERADITVTVLRGDPAFGGGHVSAGQAGSSIDRLAGRQVTAPAKAAGDIERSIRCLEQANAAPLIGSHDLRDPILVM